MFNYICRKLDLTFASGFCIRFSDSEQHYMKSVILIFGRKISFNAAKDLLKMFSLKMLHYHAITATPCFTQIYWQKKRKPCKIGKSVKCIEMPHFFWKSVFNCLLTLNKRDYLSVSWKTCWNTSTLFFKYNYPERAVYQIYRGVFIN